MYVICETQWKRTSRHLFDSEQQQQQQQQQKTILTVFELFAHIRLTRYSN